MCYTTDEPTGTRNNAYRLSGVLYVGKFGGADAVDDCIRGKLGVVIPPLGTWKIVASSSVLSTIHSPI